MALSERVSHFVDDAAKVSLGSITIPEREGREFVEEVARKCDQAHPAGLERNAGGRKDVLRPRPEAAGPLVAAVIEMCVRMGVPASWNWIRSGLVVTS